VMSQKEHYMHLGLEEDFVTRSGEVNAESNLVGACVSCNSAKGAKAIGSGPGEWWPTGWSEGAWWPFGRPPP